MRVSSPLTSVRIARPICAVSPGSAARLITVPAAGARKLNWSSRVAAAFSAARACSSRLWASAVSAPLVLLPAVWALAARTAAALALAARWASSRRDWETKPCCTRSRARSSSRMACASAARACSNCWALTGSCTVVSWRMRPRASATAALARARLAVASSSRRRTSTCLACTVSPSRTRIASMRAVLWLAMSLRATLAIRPVVTTDCTMGPCVTTTTSTGLPRKEKMIKPILPITRQAIRTHCVRVNFIG